MRVFTIAMAAVLLLAAGDVLAEPLRHVRIDSDESPNVAASLISDGYDVLEPTIGPGSFELIVGPEELAALRGLGLDPQTIAVGRPFADIQAERLATEAVPAGYPDLATIIAELQAVTIAFPDVCKAVDLTATYGTPATVEGRDLWAVKISDNVNVDEDEPAILLVSNHHAREIVTPVIALNAIDQLTSQYGIDPTITNLVDSYEIWIAPTWNPDGYEYVFSVDNFWRKNRRVFAQGVGVDLNRNYPFGWSSACGGSTDVNSETYRGPSASSEAEIQTMIALADDRSFAKVGDFHSYAREVRYGTGCLFHPFASFLQSEAQALASTMAGYSANTSCCTGGDIHMHMGYKGSHAFLWETHTSFQPTYASAQTESATVFQSILALLDRPIPLSGHVTDAVTGEPVVANITYPGVSFTNGETNASHFRFGRYHVNFPAGTYDVQFSAPGYVTQTHTVTLTSNTAEVLDVALAPLSIVSATSLADHNGTELGLDIWSGSNVEPRISGVRKVEIVLSDPVAGASATVSCVNNFYDGSMGTTTNGNTVTVRFLSALPDEDCCDIILGGGAIGVVQVRTLAGDISRDGNVTTSDASIIKPHFNGDPAAAGPEFDFDADGAVTTSDFSQVKAFFNNAAPACP